jgi:hypothetical protein
MTKADVTGPIWLWVKVGGLLITTPYISALFPSCFELKEQAGFFRIAPAIAVIAAALEAVVLVSSRIFIRVAGQRLEAASVAMRVCMWSDNLVARDLEKRLSPLIIWANMVLAIALVWVLAQGAAKRCANPPEDGYLGLVCLGLLGFLFVDAWSGRIVARSRP